MSHHGCSQGQRIGPCAEPEKAAWRVPPLEGEDIKRELGAGEDFLLPPSCSMNVTVLGQQCEVTETLGELKPHRSLLTPILSYLPCLSETGVKRTGEWLSGLARGEEVEPQNLKGWMCLCALGTPAMSGGVQRW